MGFLHDGVELCGKWPVQETFPSWCFFSQFGNAHLSRSPMVCVVVQVWQVTFVEVWWLYPEEFMDYSDSEWWNLLEICYCFSMYRGTQYIKGAGRYNSPTLVSRGIQERPMKNSTQKTQDPLTSWGRNIWKYRSAGVLPNVKGVHLLTPPVQVVSLPKRWRTEFLLDWHRGVVVNWSLDPKSRLMVCCERQKDNSLKTNGCEYYK